MSDKETKEIIDLVAKEDNQKAIELDKKYYEKICQQNHEFAAMKKAERDEVRKASQQHDSSKKPKNVPALDEDSNIPNFEEANKEILTQIELEEKERKVNIQKYCSDLQNQVKDLNLLKEKAKKKEEESDKYI